MRMVEKQKCRNCFAPSNVFQNSHNSTLFLERTEMARLTELVRSSDFHCTFCFKTFRSAQAMGGHQNAHKADRLEEKRLFVKDPIGYRKRAFIRAMKAIDDAESSEMVNHVCCNINSPAKIPAIPNMSGDFVESSDGNFDISGKRLRMFLPIKELSLAENVGVRAEGGKSQPVMEFDFGGCRPKSENLDLTLRL